VSPDQHVEDPDGRLPGDVEGPAGACDVVSLKTGGIIKQRQRDLFTIRLKCPGGRVPLDRLARIVEVARKYGRWS